MEITLKCDECKSELNAIVTMKSILISPCQKCLDSSYKKGYAEGYEEGYECGKAIY